MAIGFPEISVGEAVRCQALSVFPLFDDLGVLAAGARSPLRCDSQERKVPQSAAENGADALRGEKFPSVEVMR